MNLLLKKKIIWSIEIIFATFCLIIVSASAVRNMSLLLSPSVSNEIIKEIISPNCEYKAVVYNRNSGATTRMNYQLSIIKSNEALNNKKGTVFISYSEITVEWENDKTLLVRILGNDTIFEQKHEFNGIDIVYSYGPT